MLAANALSEVTPMSEIEITVRAHFSAKVDLAKTVRRIVFLTACALGLLHPYDFTGFKTPINPVITGKYISKV